MARKRTTKPTPKLEQNFGPMDFPDIGGPDPSDVQDTKSDPNAELQRQLDEMRAQNTRLQEDLARVVSVPQVTVAPTAPKGISYDNLPDPVTDPAAYGQALGQRIVENAQAQRGYEQTNQAIVQEREGKIEALWEDFDNAYPEIAKDKEGMEFVVMQVAKRAKTRGADLDRYMFVTREKFMGDVAKAYEARFGEAEDDEPAPKPRRQRARPDDDEPTRTSVFGGLEGGGRPTQVAKDNPSESSMVKEIQEMQLSSGFYGARPHKS